MLLSDFDFNLPQALIAQQPLKNRSDSKLLVVTPNAFIDSQFKNIGSFLKAGDLLVLNDTKVIPARLHARKQSGGQVEVMIQRIVDAETVEAMIKASKAPRPETKLTFSDDTVMKVSQKNGFIYTLKTLAKIDLTDFINTLGKTPLPPYIKRQAQQQDKQRYQTVFAKNSGAVAAPTAGLHLTKPLLKTLQQQGINHCFLTLHVGAGTFEPIRSETIQRHRMHSDYHIPEKTAHAIKQTKDNGGRIIAVGTTVVRTLEAALSKTPAQLSGDTDIFIYPGFVFKTVDMMVTNFHLPKSSLLLLVSAFCGSAKIKSAYEHAISQNYRFFSYGDAMLIANSTL